MEINDTYILEHFLNKNNKPNGNAFRYIKDDEKQYLLFRFDDDTIDLKEIIYRIYHKIEAKPVCPICGKPTHFIRWNKGYRTYCSRKCAQQSNIVRTNYINTIKEKYGSTYINAGGVPEIKQKVKTTLQEKYGVNNISQVSEICVKSKQTLHNTLYGNANKFNTKNEAYSYFCSYVNNNTFNDWYNGIHNELIKKKKNTLYKHYNTYCYFNSYEYKNIYYGNKNKFFSKEIAYSYFCSYIIADNFNDWYYGLKNKIEQKIYNTMLKNNSFNISKDEEECYNILKNKFSYTDIKRQYKSKLYPFKCDFYIKSIDTYIEYNGTWTHGNHKFNCNNIDDIKTLNEWKEKSKMSNYYKSAIYTWTNLDIRKYNIAKQNNLNYIVFWNLNEIKKWIEK